MSDRLILDALRDNGFAIIPKVFMASECEAMRDEICAALNVRTDYQEAIRSRSGVVYAGRNLLDVYPQCRDVWCRSPLVDVLAAALGKNAGLVRALFFDKPPERTWSLPWHKDMTIAVRDNRLASFRLTKPTMKAGVPHMEAPEEVLDSMLTLRIHLDDMNEENGPLNVIPGSHRSKDDSAVHAAARPIHLCCGDVFAMRPLLTHSSASSLAGTKLHRRLLHLEFAASEQLPDGFQWHRFVPIA